MVGGLAAAAFGLAGGWGLVPGAGIVCCVAGVGVPGAGAVAGAAAPGAAGVAVIGRGNARVGGVVAPGAAGVAAGAAGLAGALVGSFASSGKASASGVRIFRNVFTMVPWFAVRERSTEYGRGSQQQEEVSRGGRLRE